MNIQAINASPVLGRRQVPRNNVSFGKKMEIKNQHIKNAGETVSNVAKKTGETIGNTAKFIAAEVKKGAGVFSEAAVRGFKKGKQNVANFIANHKGTKGVKLVATALTAIVAGGFAIKEVYDIATKSNPER